MKITKLQLKRYIKEELQKEGFMDWFKKTPEEPKTPTGDEYGKFGRPTYEREEEGKRKWQNWIESAEIEYGDIKDPIRKLNLYGSGNSCDHESNCRVKRLRWEEWDSSHNPDDKSVHLDYLDIYAKDGGFGVKAWIDSLNEKGLWNHQADKDGNIHANWGEGRRKAEELADAYKNPQFQDDRSRYWENLNKSQLKQIIKEEMGEYTTSMVTLEDALKTVLPTIENAYASLSDDSSKAAFEDYLLKNIAMYVDKWREERQGAGEY